MICPPVNPAPAPLRQFDLVVGFDTEYVREAPRTREVLEEDPEDAIRRGNKVLCISYAILDPETGRRWSGVAHIEPMRKRRWSLKQFLEQIEIVALDLGILTPERMRAANERLPKRTLRGLRICLLAHFSRADLPGFSDFRRLKRAFSAVRKTYVTIEKPYVLTTRPRNYRTKTSVTLRDTRLLAPAGYGSLSAIGDMLGFPKLTVPDVEDENGAIVPGITRMDLVQARHRAEFEAYAIRDAEIAVDFAERVAALAAEWGCDRLPATIGSLGVEAFVRGAEDFVGFCGRVPDSESRRGRRLVLHPVLAAHSGMWANAYRGGRNEAFAHGIFQAPEGRRWNDIDLASAYTTVMAGLPPIDWDSLTMPTDLDQIAVLDAATVAQVHFRFPPGARFPCLPVPAGAGLLFPLEGEATTTGAELLAAMNMGAEITLFSGLRFEFRDGAREFANFSRMIAAERARYKVANPVFEKLVKEAGNSVYGKTAQAVSGMRSINPDRNRYFDTLSGQRRELSPSRITNPVHAAITTATLRAVVSEILASLPRDRTVLSVTTDGFLTDATLEEALEACGGPLATWFKAALADIAPGKSLLEVKHEALAVAIARTRGAIAVTAPDGYDGPPILARAGHRIEGFDGSAWEEASAFLNTFISRTPDLTLSSRDLISVADQWLADADLVAIPIKRRINFDYDMGGMPVEPREEQGVLQFMTKPWPNKSAYEAGRRAHEKLRKNGGHLKTLDDWRLIEGAVRRGGEIMQVVGGGAVAGWLRAKIATEFCGKEGQLTFREAAATLDALGLPTTPSQLSDAGKKARSRGLLSIPNALAALIDAQLFAGTDAPNRFFEQSGTWHHFMRLHILKNKTRPKS